MWREDSAVCRRKPIIIIIVIILVKLFAFSPYINVEAHGAHGSKSKGFMGANVSFKLIYPWQSSGSRQVQSTKPVGAQERL